MVKECVDAAVKRMRGADRGAAALRAASARRSGHRRGAAIEPVRSDTDGQFNEEAGAFGVFAAIVQDRSGNDRRLPAEVRRAVALRDDMLSAAARGDHTTVDRLTDDAVALVRSVPVPVLAASAGVRAGKPGSAVHATRPRQGAARDRGASAGPNRNRPPATALIAFTERLAVTRSAAEGFYRLLRAQCGAVGQVDEIRSRFQDIARRRPIESCGPAIYLRDQPVLDCLWRRARDVRWVLPEYLQALPARRGPTARRMPRYVKTVVLCGDLPAVNLRKLTVGETLDSATLELLHKIATDDPSKRAKVDTYLRKESEHYGAARPKPPVEYRKTLRRDTRVDLLAPKFICVLFARGPRWAAAHFTAACFFRHPQTCLTEVPLTMPGDPWLERLLPLLLATPRKPNQSGT